MSAFGSPILTSAFGQKHGGWRRRRPSKARRPCGRTRRSKASESDARSSGDSHRAATRPHPPFHRLPYRARPRSSMPSPLTTVMATRPALDFRNKNVFSAGILIGVEKSAESPLERFEDGCVIAAGAAITRDNSRRAGAARRSLSSIATALRLDACNLRLPIPKTYAVFSTRRSTEWSRRVWKF